MAGVEWADATYQMITANPLLVAFVLMCAIVVGIAVIRKLINS